MRWPVKKLTPEQVEEWSWSPHLPIIPIRIGDEWIWLEWVDRKWIGFEESIRRGLPSPFEYRERTAR